MNRKRTSRYWQSLIGALFIALMSGPCIAGSETLPCDYRAFGLDAEKFFIYLTQDSPYTAWRIWPGKPKLSPAEEPHGAYITTYVNPAAYESITAGNEMVFGSLIVSEAYNADRLLIGLYAKIRIKGYKPEADDWYWFNYSPEGRSMADGAPRECIRCHAQAADNNYILTAPFRKFQ